MIQSSGNMLENTRVVTEDDYWISRRNNRDFHLYRSPRTLYRIVSGIFGGMIACFAVILLSATGALAGGTLAAMVVAMLLWFALYLTSGVFIFLFLHRTYRNLYAFGEEDLESSPGWTIGWFFIPVMSFFKPYQVTAELWRRSNIKYNLKDNDAVQPKPVLIGWWWAFYILWSIFLNIYLRLLGESSKTVSSASIGIFTAIFFIVAVIGMLITILMVRQINRMQCQKYSLITRDSVLFSG